MLKRWIRSIVIDILTVDHNIVEIDPNKNYILVLPTDLSPTVVKAQLEAFQGKVNMAVLHADHFTIVESK